MPCCTSSVSARRISASSGVSCVTTESSNPCSLSCSVWRRSRPVRLVRNVLRRMRNIHARKLVPSRKLLVAFSALANVSCTRSRASSGSPLIQRAKLYSGSRSGSANFSNSCLEIPLNVPSTSRWNTCMLRLRLPCRRVILTAGRVASVFGLTPSGPAILRSDDSTFFALLHDNFRRHLGMKRAEVFVRSRFVELELKFLVRVHHLGLEELVRARHRVWNVVTVGPVNSGSGFHRHGGRIESEIIDLHVCLPVIRQSGCVRGAGHQRHTRKNYNHSCNQQIFLCHHLLRHFS